MCARINIFYYTELMKCGSETRVQEVDKHNPGVIDEIREMKYIKEAAQ